MGNKSKPTDLESAAGVFQSIITELMRPVRDGRVPFEAVRHLATPEGADTIARMTEVMARGWEVAARDESIMSAAIPPSTRRTLGVIFAPEMPVDDFFDRVVRMADLNWPIHRHYRNWVRPESMGKSYEVIQIGFDRPVPYRNLRSFLSREGYRGNATAFMAAVAELRLPMGHYVTVLDEGDLAKDVGGAYAPIFDHHENPWPKDSWLYKFERRLVMTQVSSFEMHPDTFALAFREVGGK